MVNVGSVEATVVPDASNFFRDLSAKLNPQAVRFGDDLGKRVSEAMQARIAAARPELTVGADTTRARAEVDKFVADTAVKTKAASAKAGDDGGSALAQGMRQSFIRSSPLIAAAVAGGLATGAPLAIAGAGLLFGGIAAAAVHSNEQVQAAFKSAGDAIKSTFTSAAQVTVPMFVGAMTRIGQAVTALGPQLHIAFAQLAAPIDSLTTGFINLIDNAMPGFTAAMKAAGPVFQGLSNLMSSIGTGLGQFFQLVSQHGQAAGQVFSAIGQIVGELLPTLGQLVGAGAELGARVLPVVVDVLRALNTVLRFIEPVLPTVLAGFLAFKAVSALSGPLDGLAGRLSNVGGLGGKAASAVSGLGTALPALGAVLGLVGAAFQQSQQTIDGWGQAIVDGGASAEKATKQAADMADGWGKLAVSTNGVSNAVEPFFHLLGLGTNASDSAATAAKKLYDAMSPLQQKQQDVAAATNELQKVLADPNHTAAQAAAASADLATKQQTLTTFQQQVATATQTATDAIYAMITAELAQANADVGAALAMDQTTKSIDQYKQGIQNHTIALADQKQAQDTVAQSILQAVAAAGKQAEQDNSSLPPAEQHAKVVQAQRDAFDQLTKQLGFVPPALSSLNDSLHGNAQVADVTAQHMTDLGLTVDGMPREHFIQIDAPTAAQTQALHDLGYVTQTLPNGKVIVTANTADARAQLDQLVRDYQNRQIAIAGGNAGPAAYRVTSSGGAATGGILGSGVLPGYTPGRDVHSFYSPSAGMVLNLSGGESVMRPEFTAAVGPGWVNSANAAARSGGIAGVRATLGLADGGFVPSSIFPMYKRMDASLSPAAIAQAQSIISKMVPPATFAPGAPSSVQGNAAIVQAMAAARGWTGAEWNALYALVMRESGFRNTAQNPTSTAYGMFQFLDSTWAGYGLHKTSDPAAQTRAGLDYIAGRYRDPLGAWGHETKFGWYDQGGLIPPGPSLVYNGTGQPELVAPKQTFQQVMSGAGTQQPAQFTGNLYLDSGEFMGKVAGVAMQVATDTLDAEFNAGAF